MLLRHGYVLTLGLLTGSACVGVDGQVEGQDDELASTSEHLSIEERGSNCSRDPKVIAGVISIETCIGGDLFFREDFGGNGRSCATCHPVARNGTIDPAFIRTLPARDPLFVAEFNPTLARLEVPAKMREFSLILENVDGFAPDPTVRFTLRSVPHTLSLATSVLLPPGAPATPAEHTGWSGDGAPNAGSLRDFQTGAITQHYTKNLARRPGTDFILANDTELGHIDTFMRRTGRTNELALATVVMSDPGAELGRQVFLAVGCNGCHSNAGANAGFGGGGNRNFNTGVETARHASLASFPIDGGLGQTPANPNGSFGSGVFNTTPLIEAADTGPFFHTATTISGASAHNTPFAQTIEQAIAFYDSPAFNNSPSGLVGPINITDVEINNIGRFLRGLNVVFNAAQAIKRIDGAVLVTNRFHNTQLATQRELARLANVEVADGIRMLSQISGLNPTQLSQLRSAQSALNTAQSTSVESTRLAALRSARASLVTASGGIGTNLNMTIGEATNMF